MICSKNFWNSFLDGIFSPKRENISSNQKQQTSKKLLCSVSPYIAILTLLLNLTARWAPFKILRIKGWRTRGIGNPACVVGNPPCVESCFTCHWHPTSLSTRTLYRIAWIRAVFLSRHIGYTTYCTYQRESANNSANI